MTNPQNAQSSALLECPNCQSPVSPGDIYCPNCNVNLAVAAILRERQVLAAVPALPDAPYVSDLTLPRFGEFLLQAGYITASDLEQALKKQSELTASGTPSTLGQVLLNLNLVTREQLDIASVQQVRQLQTALQENNRDLEKRVAQRTQELQRALTYLNELNQLKSNFISNVSHELRTPLAHIQGYSQLLKDDALGPLNEDQGQAVQVIGQAANRLSGLIENLLSYATASQGKLVISPTAFSLEEMIRAALERPAINVARVRIHFETEMEPNLPLALADKDKISWVIEELLNNAIKYTSDAGEILVTAGQREQRLHISVRDTGQGIAPGRITELFEPFHQLDGSMTRRQGGTGLGLALVKQIVEAHGSEVAVMSQEGMGTVFSFDLPIAMS
jgi:signal transduction histidine kinase